MGATSSKLSVPSGEITAYHQRNHPVSISWLTEMRGIFSPYAYMMTAWDILEQKYHVKPSLIDATCLERMKNKVIIVTGANAGVGKDTVKWFYLNGANVIVACRSKERGMDAIRDIEKQIAADRAIDRLTTRKEPTPLGTMTFMSLDLNSQNSIRSFASQIQEKKQKVDYLILNAGVMSVPYSAGNEDHVPESHFAVNHLGHFLLTVLVLPLMNLQSGRIVSVSSLAYLFHNLKLDDMTFKKHRYDPFEAYAGSKLCNILFTKCLARKIKTSQAKKDKSSCNITINAVHPGMIVTEIARNLGELIHRAYQLIFRYILLTPMEGAIGSVFAATSPKLDSISGEFLVHATKIFNPSPKECNVQLEDQLWDMSLSLARVSDLELAKFQEALDS